MPRPPAPPLPRAGDERATLTAFLDFHRAALIDRTWGLDDDQLRITHPPSTLTLARLVSHMAWVEQTWFRARFAGEPMAEPFASLDFTDDRDAEMTRGQDWSRAELLAAFEAAVDDARARTAGASLDQLSVRTDRAGERWSLRWILVHMIEEYARHCGHADLLRESIDGDVAS
ncbi:DinB family protein [Salsipaludibacter albus]|uniref:DinB family protein n=1 Tax=Salsipaludibacter albus TaxID=2849650 RepID=UPI001EE4D3C6|nr:DinB family protein [Salsipaludibacter albus]MBY5163384.1 DinB family protein [Salsipaludibacter albus]